MNHDSDVDDSESIHKCQKSIFYMLIDNIMLTERKMRNSDVWKCSAQQSTACTQQNTWDLSELTNNSWVERLRHLFTTSGSRAAWRQLLAVSC